MLLLYCQLLLRFLFLFVFCYYSAFSDAWRNCWRIKCGDNKNFYLFLNLMQIFPSFTSKYDVYYRFMIDAFCSKNKNKWTKKPLHFCIQLKNFKKSRMFREFPNSFLHLLKWWYFSFKSIIYYIMLIDILILSHQCVT